ncbi:MAG: transporter [Alphaproteobacteria bacterium]|nr:transporter [Alphaproteobacteria bacterium]
MGSITPILSQGIGLANAITGGGLPFLGPVSKVLDIQNSGRQQREEQNMALRQLQQQQAMQQTQSIAQAGLEKQKIATQAAQAESDRRTALKRAVARQRAQFGSQGVGSDGGSSQAVLLGLFDESEDELKKREQLDALKINALDQGISQSQSLNLLQAQQLRERQKLARLF